MNDATKREAILRYWEWEGRDSGLAHKIYHDDAVLEFPQSGERFVGKQNFKVWREMYPADVDMRLRRLTGRSNDWVAEGILSYNGGPWLFGVSFMHFRGDKVDFERIYVMDGFEAPDWRSEWAERFDPLPAMPGHSSKEASELLG